MNIISNVIMALTPKGGIVPSLKKLRFVESAITDGKSYTFTTKKDTLKTTLRFFVESCEGTGRSVYTSNHRLKKPVTITMPRYKIRLYRNTFSIALVDKPNLVNGDRVHPFPQEMSTGISADSWDGFKAVCLGVYDRTYEGLSSWPERALLAAEYLQCAKPDMGGEPKVSTWAYRLGLVGDEVVYKPPKPKRGPKKPKATSTLLPKGQVELRRIQDLYVQLTGIQGI